MARQPRRKPRTEQTDGEVRLFYNQLDVLIRERKITWSMLSEMIGLRPNTLATMRSLNTNPSILTAKKIADALDVSLDELFIDSMKTNELYELYWFVPRLIIDKNVQGMLCKLFLTQCLSAAGLNDTDHRDVISRVEIRQRYEMRKAQYAEREKEESLKNEASE